MDDNPYFLEQINSYFIPDLKRIIYVDNQSLRENEWMTCYGIVSSECNEETGPLTYCYLIFVIYMIRKCKMKDTKISRVIVDFKHMQRLYVDPRKDETIKLEFF